MDIRELSVGDTLQFGRFDGPGRSTAKIERLGASQVHLDDGTRFGIEDYEDLVVGREPNTDCPNVSNPIVLREYSREDDTTGWSWKCPCGQGGRVDGGKSGARQAALDHLVNDHGMPRRGFYLHG